MNSSNNRADVTRRHFLGGGTAGIGAAALSSLLMQEGLLADDKTTGPVAIENPLAAKQPPLRARAKNVIYLHMAGSPPQQELFDYKPKLQEFNDKDCPEEYLSGERFAFIKGTPQLLGTPYKFARHGESGQHISELLPKLSSMADDICIVRSLYSDQFNHAPAQMLLYTGFSQFGKPSMGSWITYGLGSENQDLPGFVVLVSGNKIPSAGKSAWGSGFLPGIFQGVQCRTSGEPVLFVHGMSDPLEVWQPLFTALVDRDSRTHFPPGSPPEIHAVYEAAIYAVPGNPRFFATVLAQFGYHVPSTPYGLFVIVPEHADRTKVPFVEEWWHTDGIYVWKEGEPRLTGMAAAQAVQASFEQAAASLPFRATGGVFCQTLKLAENRYRIYLLDSGWLDPADRDVTLKVQVPGKIALRDLLSGRAVPLSLRTAQLTVSAGSLRILEATVNSIPTPKIVQPVRIP